LVKTAKRSRGHPRPVVARIERSEIREQCFGRPPIPAFTAFKPGYGCCHRDLLPNFPPVIS